MKIHNSLGETLNVASERIKLDENIKKLLSHKQILAFILKHTVPEYASTP